MLVVSHNIYYVSTNANDEDLGTEWTTAKRTIQSAIDNAPVGGHIWVSNGIYVSGGKIGAGLITNRITIDKQVIVESVNGPTVTTIVGASDSVNTNGYAAVRCAYLINGARLIGFTLTNGYTLSSYSWPDGYGGGIFCESDAIVRNVLLSGNTAFYNGGGGYGGQLYNCDIIANESISGGGFAYGTLHNCLLSYNSAVKGGGAYYCTLYSCRLNGNSSSQEGGGSYHSPLFNCTLTGNAAQKGGGVQDGIIYNSIIYYNNASDGANWRGQGANTFVNTRVCTTPMPPGSNCITNEPLFITIGTGYGTNHVAGDCRLQFSSPCVNMGTNQDWMSIATDLDAKPRIIDGQVDMGAYEYGVPTDYQLWLQRYCLATDGSADFTDDDEDTFINWDEWYSGTIPTDSYSYFKLCAITNLDAEGTVIRWPIITNRTYIINYCTSMSKGTPYMKLATNIVGTSYFTEYQDTSSVGNAEKFYRIGVE